MRKAEKDVFMSAENCPYCHGGPALAEFAVKIDDISEYSSLYLFKEQSHPGRMVVAYRGHVSEIVDITPEQLQGFMADVARVARLIHKMFHPQKVNYGAFGDLNPHLHFHLVPKYEGQFEWGGTFQMNPHAVMLSDAECAEMIERIRKELPGV